MSRKNCPIDPSESPINEVRDLVNKRKFGFLKGRPDDTFDDVIARREILNKLFTTELVDNSKLVKGLHLDPSGKTARYVWIDTKELAAQGRVTDKNKVNFVKRQGKKQADELSNTPDNVVKRNGGTRFHKAAQDLMEVVKFINKDFIANPPSKEFIKDIKTIMEELDANPNDFNELYEEIKKQVKFAIDVQNSIDPTAKVYIKAEDFNLDLEEGIGGTADLLFIYSDKSASLFDYKTITPNFTKVDSTGKIIKEDWIPQYKMDEFNVQIPKLMDMYKKTGITSFRHARIIPVQIGFNEKLKADTTKVEGARLTSKITNLRVGYEKERKEYLSQIPIMLESTGNEGLDKALSEANKLKHNLTKRLDRTTEDAAESFKLRGRIKKVNNLINTIMLNKNIDGFVELYKDLVERYLDVNRTLVSDYMEEGNTKFLSLAKIEDLKADLKIFDAIAFSIPEFVKTLDTYTDEQKKKSFDLLDVLTSKSGQLYKALQQRTIDLSLNEDDQLSRAGDKNLTLWDRYFRRFSNITNTIFQKARGYIETANNKTRLDLNKFTTKLDKLNKAVQVWGESNGLYGFKSFEPLINKKSGNLHTRYKSELYDTLEQARREQDDKTLDSMIKLRDDAEQRFSVALQRHMIFNSFSVKDTTEKKELVDWIAENDPSKQTSKVKYGEFWNKYYEIDESKIPNDMFNPDYLIIKNNKPLLDYYNFWEDSMEMFRGMLDIKYRKVPNNFIPWIKADAIERYLNGHSMFSKDSFKNLLSVEENNELVFKEGYITLRGEIDPETGLQKREIPKYFINPLVNNQGDIDNSLKSFDLSASITVFAQMAFNYNNLKHTESTLEALKDILAEQGVNQTTADGNAVRIPNDQSPQREKGAQTKESILLEDMINYHLYGVFYKDKPSKAMQALLSLKRYQQLKELALSPIASTVNIMGARTNALFEGVKGYFYTPSMWAKSLKDRYDNKEVYFALANFIQPYQGNNVENIAKKLKGNKIAKNINYDTLFAGFRIGDEHIDEQVMYSMLQNYALVDGKLVRLNSKLVDKGETKSLLENTKIEDDNLIIEGLLDKEGNVNEEVYLQLRNLILNTTTSIKGGLNSQDMNAVNMTIIGKMAMSFRNWLPALAEERFRGINNVLSKQSLRYNPQTNTVTEARYTALISDVVDSDVVSVMNLLKYVSLASAKLAVNVVTFNKTKFGKANEERARVLYEKFLEDNAHLAAVRNGSLTFEDFLDYKNGQIKALATEMRYILAIVTLLAVLGGGFDDDDKFTKKNWATRTTFRVLNRYRRELMGIVNPQDWVSLTRNPIPVASLAYEGIKTITNTFDEAFDDLFGEAQGRSIINPAGKKSKDDKTERLHYTLGWIPGYKLIKMFEPTEESKKSKY